MWLDVPDCIEDGRNIRGGRELPTKFYADQPYFAATADGGLLLVVTTGLGHEGSRGQHVLAMKTFDKGKTWQDIQPVESPDGPESSWGIPFTAPSGRVFVFYVYNADDLRDLPADDPPYPGGLTQRMDSHGYYVFRWSDDHGKTWSKERGAIPVREFEIDRNNPTGGKVRFFWNVGTAFAKQERLFLPIHKVGGLGDGWFTSSEGGLLRSDDLLTVADPLQATWETLPAGEIGIRAPKGGGPIAEEHSFVVLSDGSIFTVFRTIDGYSACAYSRDDGKSWEPSQYMRFADGRLMKHPRAANFVWPRKDGGYIYCFHNHGGTCLGQHPERRTLGYNGRNPMFLSRGWEVQTHGGLELRWSEPEIILYDDDPMVRISYPDMIELDGEMLISETQKSTARIHVVPAHLDDALSASENKRAQGLAQLTPLLAWQREGGLRTIGMPALPEFLARNPHAPYGGTRTRKGFAMELLIEIEDWTQAATLFNGKAPDGSAIEVKWTTDHTLHCLLCDGRTNLVWESDPVQIPHSREHFIINVDGGSNTLSFFHNGRFCDGRESRQYGWGRISPDFRNTYAVKELFIGESEVAWLEKMVFYPRILTAAEVQLSWQKQSKLCQVAVEAEAAYK